MRVFVYVEGPSDVSGLGALWGPWQAKLGRAGHGFDILHLDNKSKFLRKIGHRAAAALLDYPDCAVVAMPDLYPTQGYENIPYAHSDLDALRHVQRREVERALTDNVGKKEARSTLARFHPTALKHDLEMLLLAAEPQLRLRLGVSKELDAWRKPVEDQNQLLPPKKVVNDLFWKHLKKGYRETVDAPRILREVQSMQEILHDRHGLLQCPIYKATVDWIATRTGVPYP